MGNRSSNVQLSEESRELAITIFREIDVDGSLTIDREETERWWRNTKFAKLSIKAMFDAVDADNNGSIEFNEWLDFWTSVKQHGHSDEEIVEELLNIRNHGTWVGFSGLPQHAHSSKD